MIKDLLVVIDGLGEAVGPYALALARMLGASVSSLCLRAEPDDGNLALAEVRPDCNPARLSPQTQVA
ncbi:hypothetical protein [Methylobacterium isbiliense]|uniref:Uncharacterized protein n=1 Tax=Methylobacterium isbiliense TaxID=315478 RepID=A0ABQ4SPA5_9HYPH|nr:hypothetical protein [Methylobacterium isbiliense]MDN3626461.1 hypothetical protein [Methylobacterium isbiliense]GJE04339.1 hypothetical protein GMJLKIPL_6300 [Methylobacterium isbiliense]